MNYEILESLKTFEKQLKEQEEKFTIMDKLEILFYRIFGNFIDFFRSDLPQGLKNFWTFRKVIWRFRWFDYSYGDDIIRKVYEEMADNWHKGYSLNAPKDEKELKIIVELFKRMENATYLISDGDEEDKIRKEIFRRIARKRYWD